jgi:hypothetical protein
MAEQANHRRFLFHPRDRPAALRQPCRLPPLVDKNVTLADRAEGGGSRTQSRSLGRLPWMNSLLIKARRLLPVFVLFWLTRLSFRRRQCPGT